MTMALPHSALLEAVLFAAGEALPKKRLEKLLEVSRAELTDATTELRDALQARGLALVETDDELELRTTGEASTTVQKLRESELSRDLGKASLETLAFILYRGSATRTEIDWVRGVNSGAALRTLLLRGLIERTEDSTDKRRARYKTTVDALAHLGVDSREALPRYAEFMTTITEQESKAPEPAV